MNKSTSTLDTDELFHLALNATNSDKNEDAIEYLKRAQELSPDNANVIYLLGAVHAQIGMFDRAVDEMSKAVEIDPSMSSAHFQLGMLYITSGRRKEAENAWLALDDLGEEHPFYLFKTGLLHLANDEFSECIDCLKRGIEVNDINEPLNHDMRKVLASAEQALEQRGKVRSIMEKATAPQKSPTKRLLSAYENENDEQDKHG